MSSSRSVSQLSPSITASRIVVENMESDYIGDSKSKQISYNKVKDVDKWKRNILKIKRNLGQVYISNKGKQFNKKEMHTYMQYKMQIQIYNKLYSVRKQLLESFWKITNVTKQRTFIVKCTTIVLPKYKYQKVDSNRLANNRFYLL